MAVDLIPIPPEIQEDIKEDLAVLNDGQIENLKASPFITEPKKKATFKPPPPNLQEETEEEEPAPRKKTGRKKELSEKQKAHLARMRQKKIDKANEKLADKGAEKKIELPSPEELALKDETVKVTIALSKTSVDFFKNEAKKHNTQYQKMIRRLLDEYAAHQ